MESQQPILSFTKEQYQYLIRWMEEGENPDSSMPIDYELRIKKISQSIALVRKKLSVYAFVNDEEEIDFFKNQFPQLLSLQIYEKEQMDLECISKIASQNLRAELIERKFNRIDLFFREHTEFIRYYYSRSTYHDATYFLSRNKNLPEDTTFHPDLEKEDHCLVYVNKIATILAYSKLLIEFEHLLGNKDRPATESNGNKIQPHQQLTWTDSKQGLVELIYCLKERGAFNEGHADLKTIIQFFEKTFSVQLGNTSSMFQKILARKTGQTQFIDQLRKNLISRIEEIDDRNLNYRK